MPNKKHAAARNPIGIVVELRGSTAVLASADLAIPKKLMANDFTKQVTASAAVRAKVAPHNANAIFIPLEKSTEL